jgi:hypothetical protein
LEDVKLLIQLINNESRRLSKIEAKLCDQSSAIGDNSITKLSNNIESLLVELEVRIKKVIILTIKIYFKFSTRLLKIQLKQNKMIVY